MRKGFYQQLERWIGTLLPPGTGKKILWSTADLDKYLDKPNNYNWLVLVNLIGDLTDIQKKLEQIRMSGSEKLKIIIVYYNHLWEPFLNLATTTGLRRQTGEQNWLDDYDIRNLLSLAGWRTITTIRGGLSPIYLGRAVEILSKVAGYLPGIEKLSLHTAIVASKNPAPEKEYSVSIIVPARNEEGNIPRIPKNIPKFGKWQELIFVEGHSRDSTWKEIQKLVKSDKKIAVKAYHQRGIGKADAVRLGFTKARGEILLILDADLSVDPEDLIKFYRVLASGQGEFVNGCRLVYPMEKEAMRLLNKIGNKIFGWIFSRILKQRFKDTLCGTKAFFRSDYEKIRRLRNRWGGDDPFGDFDLIFGAVKYHLKIVEIPVRYKERVYGRTNISRFSHGWLLLKMVGLAMKNF